MPKPKFYSNIYSIQSIPLKTVTLLSWHPNLFQLLELIHMPQIFSYLITYSNKFVLCFRFFSLFWRPRVIIFLSRFELFFRFWFEKNQQSYCVKFQELETLFAELWIFLTFGLNILLKTNGIFGVNEITIIFWNKWNNEMFEAYGNEKNRKQI